MSALGELIKRARNTELCYLADEAEQEVKNLRQDRRVMAEKIAVQDGQIATLKAKIHDIEAHGGHSYGPSSECPVCQKGAVMG